MARRATRNAKKSATKKAKRVARKKVRKIRRRTVEPKLPALVDDVTTNDTEFEAESETNDDGSELEL